MFETDLPQPEIKHNGLAFETTAGAHLVLPVECKRHNSFFDAKHHRLCFLCAGG